MRVLLCLLMLACLYSVIYAQNDIEMSEYQGYLENDSAVDWTAYPTYEAYVQILEKWAADFPGICELHELGPTIMGRKILALKVSDNVKRKEPEPRFLQVATLTGDQPLNFMFTLHVIDTMFQSYGKDIRLTRLVDSIEFWFCPLMNPDGLYFGGNHTVEGARRGNGNNVGLDRNWPCRCGSIYHKYGLYDSLELETKALMRLHDRHKFHLEIDMHSGTEAVTWPFAAVPDSVCDKEWYRWTARSYAEQVQEDCGYNGYMMSCGGDGIGNVYMELYEIHGFYLDYFTYVENIKGVRLDNSVRKRIPTVGDIRQLWPWNKEALFMYYERLYKTGLQGVVTCASTGNPINNIKVTAEHYDHDYAVVHTDSAGFYARFISTGTYSFTFSHPDYHPKTIDNVAINSYDDKYELNVELDPATKINNTFQTALRYIKISRTNYGIKITYRKEISENVKLSIYTVHGRLMESFEIPAGESYLWQGSRNSFPDGCYIFRFEGERYILSQKIMLSN